MTRIGKILMTVDKISPLFTNQVNEDIFLQFVNIFEANNIYTTAVFRNTYTHIVHNRDIPIQTNTHRALSTSNTERENSHTMQLSHTNHMKTHTQTTLETPHHIKHQT